MNRRVERTEILRFRLRFTLRTLLMAITWLAATLALWRQTCHDTAPPEAYLGMAITGVVTALAPLVVHVVSAKTGRYQTLTIRQAFFGLAPFAWWLVFAYSLFR